MVPKLFLMAFGFFAIPYSLIDFQTSSIGEEFEHSNLNLLDAKYASVGAYDLVNVNPGDGRIAFTDKAAINEIYGNHAEKIKTNTVYVDCSSKNNSATGFFLDLSSVHFDSIQNISVYRQNCNERLVLTTAHEVDLFKKSESCKIYHSNGVEIDRISNVRQIKQGTEYSHEQRNYDDAMGKDYAFLILEKDNEKGSPGLKVCDKHHFDRTSSCSLPPDQRKLSISQAFDSGVKELYSSDQTCCVDKDYSRYDVYANKCHIWHGASGGPLVNAIKSEEPCVAGVSVGMAGGSAHNFAASLYTNQFTKDLESVLSLNCTD